MNNSFYFKLAKTNLKENKRTYFPYLLACICAIIMFYTMDCIVLNKGLENIRSGDALKKLLGFGVKIISIFSIIFLFYTNSFLIKRRKKEIGIYNVLGMEKKHIAIVLFIETVIIAIVSLILGIVGGIIIGKLLFLILLNLLQLDITISSSFSISLLAIIQTIKLFIGIFTLILIANLIQVKISNPIELLKGGQKGEKEPKASWLLAVLGIIELVAGYIIAITIESPLKALTTVFIAIILVIIGTYSTFTAGSIAFLKLLKKNKKFFYKTKNFVSVSGMIYRMKQNAVGLANICILSTAVLITISTTAALYAGQESNLIIAYPLDTAITIDNATDGEKDKVVNLIKEESVKNNVTLKDKVEYNNKEVIVLRNENLFTTTEINSSIAMDIKAMKLYTLEDYNKMEGKKVLLEDNEILMFSVGKELNYESIIINDKEFKVKDKLSKLKVENKNENNITEEYNIIVKDMDIIKDICKAEDIEYSKNPNFNIAFNIDGNKKDIIKFCDSLKNIIKKMENGYFESIFLDREDFYITNGGFIFIGSFLGLLFTMGTVLIIYYKQISEGYDDSERFKIMQKVGMSKNEVKAAINKQVLMVFFFPLIVSIIHIACAFRGVTKLLALFGLFNINVFVISIFVTIGIFAVIYVIVYGLTAKTYYKIVQQEN